MDEFSCQWVINDGELEAAFEVRRRVFVGEQGISEDEELDNLDKEALHMVAKDGDIVIGTARVLFLTGNQAKLERMAILKPYRRRGIGGRIIAFVSEELSKKQVEQVILHAQYEVTAFYKSCGFEESGPIFWEAGIKHIKMQRRL